MKGRPVRGLIGGFLLGIFVDIDLVFGGVVKLNSVVLTILPIALLVVGLLLGLWAPVGAARRSDRAAAPSPADRRRPRRTGGPGAREPSITEDTPPI